jgi:hypothetical protein
MLVPIGFPHDLTISRLAAMSTLEEWTAAVSVSLGLDQGPLTTAEIKAVLDLARDAAHAVDRVAAPLTAYQLGMAVGRGLALPEASDRVRALTADWAESAESGLNGPLRWPYEVGRHRA